MCDEMKNYASFIQWPQKLRPTSGRYTQVWVYAPGKNVSIDESFKSFIYESFILKVDYISQNTLEQNMLVLELSFMN